MKTLEICDGETLIGTLAQDDQGDLLFRYDPGWADNPESFPVSLSLPLGTRKHGHLAVANFLWGLLPENPAVLAAWGKKFQVSSNNPFALLSHVGEDCAGAIQFRQPGAGKRESGITWIPEQELETRVANLRANHGHTRKFTDQGNFSLAGTQPKLALHRDPATGRWGVPFGKNPTTHILKPTTGQWENLAENEYFCGKLAAKIGLPSAKSELLNLSSGTVICSERYDRRLTGTGFVRLHQEDFCQAIGFHPGRKYQNERGPGPGKILAVIRKHCVNPEIDAGTFVGALIFNWIILGTDGHAKNYGIFHEKGPSVRVTPLYDLTSALPYPDQFPPDKAKLAMRVGGQYQCAKIQWREWEKFGNDNGVPDIHARITKMAEKFEGACEETLREMRAQGFETPLIVELSRTITARAKSVLQMTGGGSPSASRRMGAGASVNTTAANTKF